MRPTKSLRPETDRTRQRPVARERGAVLLMVIGSLVALIGASAVAVDIAARTSTAQDLQNAADAASLAGVVVWVDTGDESATRAAVAELAAQNGVDGPGITTAVDFVDATTIRVNLTEGATASMLSVGILGDLTRSATAEFEECTGACGATIPIPEPFLTIDAEGSGDGFRPAVVGTKLYGVNHHGETMACVDRLTQAPCFEDGDLFNNGDYQTDWTVSEAVVGTKIYYLGQSNSNIRLFCWETLTDTLCAGHTLATIDGGQFRGGAVITANNQVYAVTDNHRMHCYRANGSTCPAFGSDGRATGLGSLIPPLTKKQAVGNMDQVLDPTTGRIYYTMKVKEGDAKGTYLDCWDTQFESPCGSFPPVKVDGNPQQRGGRLFLYHPPRASETDVAVASGVCATNDGAIRCYEFATAGGYQAAWGTMMQTGLLDSVDNVGTHINHPPTNRLVLQAGGLNLCWDFDTQGNCGYTDASPNKDYGFAYEGNCVFALGHNSKFHAFGMTSPQMSNSCPGTSSVARIDPCTCGGGATWPRVGFEFDLTPFTNFVVTFRDPTGAIVMGPLDMTTHPTGRLDLSSIDTTHEYLIIEVVAEVEDGLTTSPWEADQPPEIALALNRSPRLTD